MWKNLDILVVFVGVSGPEQPERVRQIKNDFSDDDEYVFTLNGPTEE